jgi:hypothetical protein
MPSGNPGLEARQLKTPQTPDESPTPTPMAHLLRHEHDDRVEGRVVAPANGCALRQRGAKLLLAENRQGLKIKIM